jgi:hypothetical protein
MNIRHTREDCFVWFDEELCSIRVLLSKSKALIQYDGQISRSLRSNFRCLWRRCDEFGEYFPQENYRLFALPEQSVVKFDEILDFLTEIESKDVITTCRTDEIHVGWCSWWSILVNLIIHSIFRNNTRFGDATSTLLLGSIFEWNGVQGSVEQLMDVKSLWSQSMDDTEMVMDWWSLNQSILTTKELIELFASMSNTWFVTFSSETVKEMTYNVCNLKDESRPSSMWESTEKLDHVF